MLPVLRIIPVGGVAVAVLILLLAISPPREARQGVAPELALARGSLIDRREHPEWPQFLVQAAYRRAGEILRLRDLPDTPMVIEPVALPPPRPVVDETPPSAPPPDSGVQSAAKALDIATQADAAPPPAEPDAPAPPAGEPVAAEPAVPAAEAPPAPLTVAALPRERPDAEPNREETTGSVSAANDATIPVDIGETSSTELPIVLPPERPPIHRVIKRERASHLVPRKRSPRRPKATARPARPSNVQPASEVNLFEALFGTGPSTSRSAATADPAYPPVAHYPFGTK
jgi:hypothetical protein